MPSADHRGQRTVSPFDIVVFAVGVVAIVLGFNAGLLRSLATIFGYVAAAPTAATVTPSVTRFAFADTQLSPDQAWWALCIVFIVIGVVLSALLRTAVKDYIGPEIGPFDRVAGAALGGVRIALVAVLVVLVFDRIIPADRQPQFLAQSQLRPFLSAAGQQGLRSLPPDVETYIDRLKREHGI
jgi:membrane protein required for colicin V production